MAVTRLLGRVSPALLESYRAGKMSLEQLQAFAISDDHEAQKQVWAGLQPWHCDPEGIRAALTQGEVSGTDRRVCLVSIEACERAGGAVRRDLFNRDEGGVYLLDPDLLDRLALEKLQSIADEIKGEGWLWVELRLQFGYDERSRFQCAHPELVPLSHETATELATLEREQDELWDQPSEDDADDQTAARLDQIAQRIEELEDRESVFTPEALAIAGTIVTIDYDGEPDIIRGLVRPEDAHRAKPATKKKATNSTVSLDSLPAALTEELTRHKSAAMAASLLQQPDTALAAIAHVLALDLFYGAADASFLQIAAKASIRAVADACAVRAASHVDWCFREVFSRGFECFTTVELRSPSMSPRFPSGALDLPEAGYNDVLDRSSVSGVAQDMGWTKHDYDDIPGTYVFDGKHAHGSYPLNKLLFSFCDEANRDEFDRDPAAYCDKYGVTGSYKEFVLKKDFLGMLAAGANIYYMAKMAIPRGTSVQDAGAAFQGITTKEFQEKLFEKAANLEEKLKARGGYWLG